MYVVRYVVVCCHVLIDLHKDTAFLRRVLTGAAGAACSRVGLNLIGALPSGKDGYDKRDKNEGLYPHPPIQPVSIRKCILVP